MDVRSWPRRRRRSAGPETDDRIDELTEALYGLASYWRSTGYTQPMLARTAQEAISAHGIPAQQAKTWLALGNVALARSDHDGARARYEQALPLYQAIHEPYSTGWTLVCLARLDPPGHERSRHWNAARQAWTSIGRDDLIKSVETEFL